MFANNMAVLRRRTVRPIVIWFAVLASAAITILLLLSTVHNSNNNKHSNKDMIGKRSVTRLFTPIHTTFIELKSVNDTNTWSIPKIIHYVWKSSIFPLYHITKIESFYKNQPDWQYYIWTDNSSRQMLADKYPEYLKKYNLFGADLLRADAIRYAILYEYGGAYFDMDTWSIRPLDDAILNHSAVLCSEAIEHTALLYSTPMILSNANMMARAKHPFFKHLMNAIPQTNESNKFQALHITGPMFLTREFHAYSKMYLQQSPEHNTKGSEVDIVSSEYFQDKIDYSQYERINILCQTPDYANDPVYKPGCDSWIKRGMVERNLSTKAYTEHEWFHTYMTDMPNGTFNVAEVIPDVKIYPNI